jgi:hypothetical protein
VKFKPKIVDRPNFEKTISPIIENKEGKQINEKEIDSSFLSKIGRNLSLLFKISRNKVYIAKKTNKIISKYNFNAISKFESIFTPWESNKLKYTKANIWLKNIVKLVIIKVLVSLLSNLLSKISLKLNPIVENIR